MSKSNEILVGVSASVGGLMHHPLIKGRDYSFDKKKDLNRVQPASILLLSEVLASGVVPPDARELEYNDIAEPDKIAGRVTNVFDAIDLGKEIVGSIPKPGTSTADPSSSSSTADPSLSTIGSSNVSPSSGSD